MDNAEGKALNIAMLGQKRVPSREGGIEIVVEELATRMAAMGHTVTCYNRRGHHVSGAEFDGAPAGQVYRGVRIKSVFTIRRRGLAALSASFVGAISAALGEYDIVHFHAEGPCAMLWLPKLLGKRCIATVHGLDWKRAKWKNGPGAVYIRLGERILVQCADEIIVLSRAMQRYFEAQYGRKTVYIPNGATPVQPVNANLIYSIGLAPREYILFLGRIVPEKGLDYLIRAYHGVQTEKKLVIAGGSSDTQRYLCQLRNAARGDARVIFTGFVTGRMLEELYSNAYFFVLPSDLEGMPLSLLEAMSYGNCCLTSDISECADVIGAHGLTFQRGNVNDLRGKLQLLCDNAALVRRYQAHAAAYICGKYSWDRTTEQTLAVYRGKTEFLPK